MPGSFPPPRIACLIDDSPASDVAVAEAVRLRALSPGRLSLVHVAPPRAVLAAGLSPWEIDEEDPLRPPRRWLEERAAAVPGAEPELLSGPTVGEVANAWLEEEGVGLVVAAAHGGRVRRAVLGSVAQDLAYSAPCNLLIARGEPTAADGPHHVGCLVDDSEGSPRAVELAREVASLASGTLSLVHVVAPPSPLPRRLVARLLPAPGRRRREAQDILRRHAAGLGGIDLVVLTGAPGPAACGWAERNGADLLVIGPRAAGRPGIGGFAERVVTSAPCSVLLARPAA